MTLIEKWRSCQISNFQPVRIAAVIEAICNLSCEHCFWAHDMRDQSRPDWKLQSSLIANMRVPVLYSGRILSTNGMAFLNACLEAGVQDFSIVDNGYTLFHAPDEWLKRFGSINISIDGWRTAHDKQRAKEGSFDVAWDAVLKLKEKGLDPIISCAFSHLTFDEWNRFQDLIEEHDVRLSSTLVISNKEVLTRGVANFIDQDTIIRAFELLLDGVPKLINLYDLEHVKVLAPILKGMKWENDTTEGDSLVAVLPNETRIVYRPQSVLCAGEIALRWDGKFYSQGVQFMQFSPIEDWAKIDPGIHEVNRAEVEAWSQIC